jgi:predicted metal-binding protein
VCHTNGRATFGLAELRDEALALGAGDACVIPSAQIQPQDAIVAMCRHPGCEGYGQCVHCPPHVMPPAEAKSWLTRFQHGVLFKIDLPPELLFSGERFDPFREVFTIASRLEARAEILGFKDARGLGAGSCKSVFCPERSCAALTPGGRCRFPRLARPSMEALGINVFELARVVNWPIHRITADSDPGEIPSAMLAGILLTSNFG